MQQYNQNIVAINENTSEKVICQYQDHLSPSLCSWSKFTALRDVPLLEVLFTLFFVTNVILPFLHIILKDHYTIKYYWFWL